MYTLLGSIAAILAFHLYGYLTYLAAFSLKQDYAALSLMVFGVIALEFFAGLAAFIRRLVSKVPRKPSPSIDFTYLLLGVMAGLALARVDLEQLRNHVKGTGTSLQALNINPSIYYGWDVLAFALMVYGFFNACSNLRYALTTPRVTAPPVPVSAPTGPQIHQRYTLEGLQTMDDRDFERLVAGYFKATGHNVMLTPQSRDGGKDVVLEKDGVQTYVECKRYAADHPVGEKEVRTLLGTMTGDRVQKGIFVTSSYFSRDAEGYCH